MPTSTIELQCRPVAEFDPAHPDINVRYCIEKLRHVQKRSEPLSAARADSFDL